MANLDPLIVFKFGAFINDQRFQLGEASHGFLGGQMHQIVAIHNIQLLERGKIAQPLWQSYHLKMHQIVAIRNIQLLERGKIAQPLWQSYHLKMLYPQNFKGNEVLNLVQEQERVG